MLPVRVIWGLHIPKRQRIALLCILTIGWFVCVVSILRLHALVVLVAHPDDNTWYSSPTAYWSAIEINLAIVCASLPALRPLLVKIMPGFSSNHSARGYGSAPLSGRIKTYVVGSRITRNTVDDDVEMANKSLSSRAYPVTSSEESVHGKNIYVTHELEQHVEEQAQMSDTESQKDLVTSPQAVYAKYARKT